MAALAWVLFLPPALALGIRRYDYLLLVSVLVCVGAALSFVAMRRRRVRPPILCAAITAIMMAAVASSRVMGPLTMMPTVLAAWAIVMQTSPDRTLRGSA